MRCGTPPDSLARMDGDTKVQALRSNAGAVLTICLRARCRVSGRGSGALVRLLHGAAAAAHADAAGHAGAGRPAVPRGRLPGGRGRRAGAARGFPRLAHRLAQGQAQGCPAGRHAPPRTGMHYCTFPFSYPMNNSAVLHRKTSEPSCKEAEYPQYVYGP